MDLEKNKQRIEILAAEIEELKNSGGGGGDLYDYLTKDEASSTYETQTSASSALATKADKATTYTKTEVDEAIASAAGGDVVVDGENVKTKNAGLGKGILIGNQAGFNSLATDNPQIAIGTRAGIIKPSGEHPIAIGYQAQGKGSDIVIGALSANNGNSTKNTLIGERIDARGGNGVGIGYSTRVGDNCVSIGFGSGANYTQNGTYVGFGCQAKTDTQNTIGQTAIGTAVRVGGSHCIGIGEGLEVNTKQVVLGRHNVESNDENCFIVGNGSDSLNKSNLIEITTPFTVSTDGIEVNGTPYGQTATSSETLPSAGTGTTFDTGIEWTYIQTKNDFILDSNGAQIKFRYGFTNSGSLHYFGYILESSTTKIVHLELGAPTGSGTTALATWLSSGAVPTT
jgi:hypothetical protein